MTDKKESNLLCGKSHNQGRSQSQSQGREETWTKERLYGLSLIGVINAVKQKIEYDCFFEEDKPTAESICRIVAEVLYLPDDFSVSIEGEHLPARIVKEVYALLEHEHVETVLRKFEEITYRLRSPKSYFRTALYNTVLDSSIAISNEVRADLNLNL